MTAFSTAVLAQSSASAAQNFYESRFTPADHNSGATTESRLGLAVPVYKSESGITLLSLSGGQLHFEKTIMLDSLVIIPNDLSRAEMGVIHSEKLPENKSWTLRGAAGYSGDKVFDGTRNMSISMNGSYSFPADNESDNWTLMFYMSNNSPFGSYFPIPGFSYTHKTENFKGTFGMPFASIQWTPAVAWSVMAGFSFSNLNTELGYEINDSSQVFTSASWGKQLYMLSNRIEEKDRLNIEEKKVTLGLRAKIFKPFTTEFQVGRSFDRSIYIGNGFSNKDGGSAPLDSGNYYSFSLRLVF